MPPPIKYTSSCREDQRLLLKVKSFRNTAIYQKLKTKGKGYINHSPPPAPGEGVQLCVYVRGLNASYHTEIEYVNLIKSIISDDQ